MLPRSPSPTAMPSYALVSPTAMSPSALVSISFEEFVPVLHIRFDLVLAVILVVFVFIKFVYMVPGIVNVKATPDTDAEDATIDDLDIGDGIDAPTADAVPAGVHVPEGAPPTQLQLAAMPIYIGKKMKGSKFHFKRYCSGLSAAHGVATFTMCEDCRPVGQNCHCN